jgi:hypothetical protein
MVYIYSLGHELTANGVILILDSLYFIQRRATTALHVQYQRRVIQFVALQKKKCGLRLFVVRDYHFSTLEFARRYNQNDVKDGRSKWRSRLRAQEHSRDGRSW